MLLSKVFKISGTGVFWQLDNLFCLRYKSARNPDKEFLLIFHMDSSLTNLVGSWHMVNIEENKHRLKILEGPIEFYEFMNVFKQYKERFPEFIPDVIDECILRAEKQIVEFFIKQN